MGGWDEEVYYSLYRAAISMAMVNKPWEDIQQAFFDAYNYRPIRAEPLFHLAQIYRTKFNKPALAYLFAKMAAEIPFPANDILFVPDIVYKFAILDEIAATAYYAGQPIVGHMACMKLLKENRVPESELPRIKANLEQYETVIAKMKQDMEAYQQQQMQSQPQQKQINKKKKFKQRK